MKLAIISGTVYGTADEVARHAKNLLQDAGLAVWHKPRATRQELEDYAPDALLVVTATTGMGELPDNLAALYHSLRDQPPAWRGFQGAIIALGDASYGDTYCGAGELVHELFAELGWHELLPMLRLDASETVTPETDAEPWLKRFAQALS